MATKQCKRVTDADTERLPKRIRDKIANEYRCAAELYDQRWQQREASGRRHVWASRYRPRRQGI